MAPQTLVARAGGVPPPGRDLALVALVLLLVDAVAAALLLFVYFPARRDEALERAPRQLVLLARDRQNALTGWVAERLADAELTAALLGKNGVDASSAALLDHYLRAYRYESALVADDRGDILLRRGRNDTDAATIVNFILRLPAGQAAAIDFRLTAARKPKILTACRLPLPRDGGRRSAVVFVSDPYDYIYPLFNTVTVASRTGETNLLGMQGDWGLNLTPLRLDHSPPMTFLAPIPRPVAARAVAEGEHSMRYFDRRGVRAIGIAKVIPRTPWILVTKMDEEEVIEVAVEDTVRLGELVAVASLLLAAAAFVILRSRRVRDMRAAEDQLARLYDNTTTGIVVVRVLLDQKGAPVDHQLVDMNPAAERFFGVTAGEEIGKTAAEAPYLQWPADIRACNYDVALTGRSAHYERYDAESKRWYETRCFSPLRGQVALLLADVTDRKASEEAVHRLSARVLRVQDETQRRIARELHETVAQSLAGLRMSLGTIGSPAVSEGTAAQILADSLTIVDDAMAEVRTVSYLLHPPMIDQAGLITALRWYVEGFQQRSGIVTSLDAPEDPGRLPRHLETAVFRIVQESLTNVQRHSGSAAAHVAIRRAEDCLWIEVADEGRGLPPVLRDDRAALLAAGVGIAGINERVHELRGELRIDSSEQGTTLTVRLPVGGEP